MLRSPSPTALVSSQLPIWIRYWSPACRPASWISELYAGKLPPSSSDATQVALQSAPWWIDIFVSSLPIEFSVSNW